MLNYPSFNPTPTKLSNAIYAALFIPRPRSYIARATDGKLFTVYLGA